MPSHLERQSGAELIAAERERQITAEGFTTEHDDGHLGWDGELDFGEIAEAAACYLLHNRANGYRAPEGAVPQRWPWELSAWKPTPGDPVRQLVKAGALIAAEIDRLERLRDGSA